MAAKAVDPKANNFPADDDTALSKKILHIGRTQSKVVIGPHRVGNNLTRKTKPLQLGKLARHLHSKPIAATGQSNNLAMPLKDCPQVSDYGPGGTISHWRELMDAAVVVVR